MDRVGGFARSYQLEGAFKMSNVAINIVIRDTDRLRALVFSQLGKRAAGSSFRRDRGILINGVSRHRAAAMPQYCID